jgi:restriction endonuclease Mrr
MAVPDFQSFFNPLLELAADGEEHSVREAREIIANRMNLSQTELSELLPSGTQTKFDNRVAWAKSYFVQAKVLNPLGEGIFESLIGDASCWRKGIPESIFGSWTSILSLLNFIPPVVTTTVNPLQKLFHHKQKHQKKPCRKHIKIFVTNWVLSC